MPPLRIAKQLNVIEQTVLGFISLPIPMPIRVLSLNGPSCKPSLYEYHVNLEKVTHSFLCCWPLRTFDM